MDRGEYIDRRTERLREELLAIVALLSLSIATIDFKTDDKGRMVVDILGVAKFREVFGKWARDNNIKILPKIGALMQDAHDLVVSEYIRRGFDVTVSKSLLGIINKLGFSKKPPDGSFGTYVAKADEVMMRLQGWVTRSMVSSVPHGTFLMDVKKIIPEEFDKYYKTHVYDLGMQFDRKANNKYAEDLGLRHFVYQGGIIDTTRSFCRERDGKLYTVDEAKEWNGLDWRGKIDGVGALVQLGGYNCRHYADYVTEDAYNFLKKDEV